MADDVAITSGVGTVVATDEVATRHFQKMKIAFGADGTVTDLSTANPLPVVQTGAPALPPLLSPTDLTEVAINCASSGNNEIVAASGALVTRVYAFFLVVAGLVSIKWRTASTDLHPALIMSAAGSGWILDKDGRPWFTCVAGEALNLNLSVAMQVSGRLYYTRT